LGAGVAVIARGSVGGVGVRADARARVANAGDMTLIEGRAEDGVRAGARRSVAGGGGGAGVAVIARGSVGGVRVRADARARVANAGDMTLIEGRAEGGVRAGARPGLAGVGLGAGVAVIARGSVGGVRVRADARARVANTGDMALIEGRAEDGVRAGAR